MRKPQVAPSTLHIIPISVSEEICCGDSIGEKLLTAMRHQKLRLQAGDILVVKHKIVSKAEGRFVALGSVRPSAASRAWAREFHLDPRVTEVALSESRRVVRRRNGVLITETPHGFICANSGVDVSNVDGGQHALLLPEDPDRSAAKIRRTLKKHLQLSIPVLITDTFGRPW